MRLTFSDHALFEMERRQIPREWILRCVEQPAKLEPDRNDATVSHALAPIEEMRGRVLCVVYNHLDNHVVTVFFERRRRGRL